MQSHPFGPQQSVRDSAKGKIISKTKDLWRNFKVSVEQRIAEKAVGVL